MRDTGRRNQDHGDYAQAFLARSPAYRQGFAALRGSTDNRSKEDFARSWGLRFPFDPDCSIRQYPAHWDPLAASMVAIVDHGDDFAPPANVSDRWHHLATDDGWHVVVQTPRCTLRFWARRTFGGTNFHLPGDQLFDGRVRATREVEGWLRGIASPPAARAAISPFKASRLDLMLALLDAEIKGGTQRALARIAYPAMPSLTAAEWKSSSERRVTRRLIAEAKRMRDGGYRSLLRSW